MHIILQPTPILAHCLRSLCRVEYSSEGVPVAWWVTVPTEEEAELARTKLTMKPLVRAQSRVLPS